MTPEQAYQMGFRHISDLAEICRIADLVENADTSALALKLMEAWRAGAQAAQAMIEKEAAVLQ